MSPCTRRPTDPALFYHGCTSGFSRGRRSCWSCPWADRRMCHAVSGATDQGCSTRHQTCRWPLSRTAGRPSAMSTWHRGSSSRCARTPSALGMCTCPASRPQTPTGRCSCHSSTRPGRQTKHILESDKALDSSHGESAARVLRGSLIDIKSLTSLVNVLIRLEKTCSLSTGVASGVYQLMPILIGNPTSY